MRSVSSLLFDVVLWSDAGCLREVLSIDESLSGGLVTLLGSEGSLMENGLSSTMGGRQSKVNDSRLMEA
jgi:hypothetical protein